MKTIHWILCMALAGCAAVPGPPEEIAPKIVALLDEGNTAEAEELFEASSFSSDQLYPLLYETARGRYERGEEEPGSAAILRFMAQQYPNSLAVREALVYALFLERAGVEQPGAELVAEIDGAIARLQQDGFASPSWVGLVQTQQAIDRGDLGTAREVFARFQQNKAETTPELTVYIEDIERYLRSHP